MKLTIAEWKTILEKAFGEVCDMSMASLQRAPRPAGSGNLDALVGAYLPLIGEGEELQIALLSNPEGCRGMAEAFVGGQVTEAGVSDAVGELLNQTAGGVQRRLQNRAQYRLGLPLFVEGRVHATRKTRSVVVQFELGQYFAALMALIPDSGRP